MRAVQKSVRARWAGREAHRASLVTVRAISDFQYLLIYSNRKRNAVSWWVLWRHRYHPSSNSAIFPSQARNTTLAQIGRLEDSLAALLKSEDEGDDEFRDANGSATLVLLNQVGAVRIAPVIYGESL